MGYTDRQARRLSVGRLFLRHARRGVQIPRWRLEHTGCRGRRTDTRRVNLRPDNIVTRRTCYGGSRARAIETRARGHNGGRGRHHGLCSTRGSGLDQVSRAGRGGSRWQARRGGHRRLSGQPGLSSPPGQYGRVRRGRPRDLLRRRESPVSQARANQQPKRRDETPNQAHQLPPSITGCMGRRRGACPIDGCSVMSHFDKTPPRASDTPTARLPARRPRMLSMRARMRT